MRHTNAKVDAYFKTLKAWRKELTKLREIALDLGLTEELKWGKPCYTTQGKNLVVLQGFKEFCAILFIKGGLIDDPTGILQKPGENTQAARRVPFTSLKGITELEPTLTALIQQALEIEKSGRKSPPRNSVADPLPEELLQKFEDAPDFKSAFEALTPGRQRAYRLYFSAAKQAKTRESRIEKCLPAIFEGKGLND